jgi:hypothetical protein
MQFYSLQPLEQEAWLLEQLDTLPSGSPRYNEMFQLFGQMSLETDNFTRESPNRKAAKIEMLKNANNFFGSDMAGETETYIENGVVKTRPKNTSAHADASKGRGYRPTGMSESIYSKGSGLAFFLQGKSKLDPSRQIFHAGTGGLEIAQNYLAGNRDFGQESGMVAALARLQAKGLVFTKTNTNMDFRALGGAYGTPAEQAIRGMELMNRGYYNVSSGGRGYTQSAIIAGASATAAYQTASGPGISRSAQLTNNLNDWMSNSGTRNIAIGAGNVFGVTQSLGMGYRGAMATPEGFKKMSVTQNMAKEFGADEIATYEMAMALQSYNDALSSQDYGRIRGAAVAYYGATNSIAAASNARAAAKTAGIGIDFDPNANAGFWQKYYVGKGKLRYRWVTTSLSSADQIREDIQASGVVSLPSAARIVAISQSFADNGNFTNFDNTAITQEAMGTLGMTEQKVFDIRFNSTRGDRELENRMRHIEQQAAASSGTSPL